MALGGVQLTPILPCLNPRDLDFRTVHINKTRRACTECNRKKSKCDMLLPSCYTCFKSGSPCTYPTSRQKRNSRLEARARTAAPPVHAGTTKHGTAPITNISALEHAFQAPIGQDVDNSTSIDDSPIEIANNTTSNSINPDKSFAPTNLMGATHTSLNESGDFTMSISGSSEIPSVIDFDWQTAQDPLFDYRNPHDLLFPVVECNSSLEEDLEIGPLPLISLDRAPKNPNINTEVSEAGLNESGIGIPWELCDELTAIFFAKVHCFIPILNKPKFTERYISHGRPELGNITQSALETSLLLNSMLALAARFSMSSYFGNIPQVERGDNFAEKAKLVYFETLRVCQTPTVEYLQGCTLLAYYLYLSGPDTQGWLIIGACSRLAYDLGINKVDLETEGDHCPYTAATWQKKEELRRLWWSIWELDTFASAISCRPHTIDKAKTVVKLPVSDVSWFSDEHVESVLVDPDPLHTWHALRDSPNQDERAWFLVVNHLLLAACKLSQLREPDRQAIENIDKAISCFALLLPPQFHLESAFGDIYFNPENFAKCNWIISTNIMVQGCKTFVRFLRERASDARGWCLSDSLLAQFAVGPHYTACVDNYRMYAEQIIRIVQKWSPVYIPHTSPFIGCLVLGPAGINLRVAMDRGKLEDDGRFIPSVDVEILKLALSHFARFWKIGAKLLEVANSMATLGGSRTPSAPIIA